MSDPLETMMAADRDALDRPLAPGAIEQRAAVLTANRHRRRTAAVVLVVLGTSGALVAAISSRQQPITAAVDEVVAETDDTGADSAGVDPSSAVDTAPSVDEFFRAIGDDQADVVRTYASTGGNLDVTNPNGIPAVMLATIRNDASMLDLLLEEGADPNKESDAGETALHMAARWGYADLAALLIEQDADVDHRLRVRDGRTPLMTAANYGHIETVEQLLAGGADPNLLDEEGFPALAYAIYGDPEGVIPALIDGGADVGIETPDGSLSDYARARGVDEAVPLLEMDPNGS